MKRAIICVAVLNLWAISLAQAKTITVDVPVLPGAEAGSRAAKFAWDFRSANGSEPITGTYACGSFWVAPAAGDSGVILQSISASSGGQAQPNHLTLDADPTTDSRGLLNNSKNYGNYSDAEALQSKLPLTFSPPSAISLVAALQRNESEAPGGGTSAIQGERVDAYCIVTILRSPPPEAGRNSIRPNITGASKEFLSWSDFDLSRLGSFDGFPALTSAAIETIATRWRHSTEIFGYTTSKTGARYTYSEGGRAFRAGLCHDEYGAGMNSTIQNDILALFSPKNTQDAKKPALASILAFALDLYHARYNSGNNERVGFTSGAGQHAGKYAPLLLLGALSTNSTKAQVLKRISITNHNTTDSIELGPQEIRQIRRGVTGIVLWGDSFPYIFDNLTSMPNGSRSRRYWIDLLEARHYQGQIPYGNPSVGQKSAGDPYGYIDGPPNYPGYAYMGIGAAATKGLAAIMITMPEIRKIVNSDLPIEFADRVHRHGTWAAPDPIAPPPPDWVENVWSPSVFPGQSFGVTWGPRPEDVRLAIESPTGTGRFKASDKHNKQLPLAFEASLARSYWDTIIARYDGERYEANFVPLSGTAKPDVMVVNGAVHISHPHPLAKIYYTTNGSAPSSSSSLYTGPFQSGAAVIKAFATTPGKNPSAVRTWSSTPEALTAPHSAQIQVY